jgi:DNA-binding NarL/FixJ family response regulator
LPNTKIIVLTAWENPALADEVTRTWASGYLLKKTTGTELILAIRCVLNGEKYVSASLQQKLSLAFPTGAIPDFTTRLTVRQREVLQVLAEGKTMKEAAGVLALSPRTVCYHKYKMMKSLGIHTNADLMRVAIKERLLFLQ